MAGRAREMREIRNFCFLLLVMAVFVFPETVQQKRFQLELFQGYTSLNPSDLNLKAVALQNRFEHAFSAYYAYLNNIQYLNSYDQNRGGEFRSLKRAFPSGVRLKYYISKLLAVSLGFKYLAKAEVSEVSEQFSIVENSGRRSFDNYDFTPFKQNVSGYIPNFGVHVGINVSDFLRMETFLSGGPIFSSFGFSYTYHIETFYGDSGVSESSDYFMEMNGKGKGLALESGVQMSLDMGRNVSVLVECGYAYQKVKNLSGSGTEDNAGLIQSWEGNWMIKEYVIYRPWGNITRTWPSNYWMGEEHLKIRDFELDLSGWQFKLGLSYGF